MFCIGVYDCICVFCIDVDYMCACLFVFLGQTVVFPHC